MRFRKFEAQNFMILDPSCSFISTFVAQNGGNVSNRKVKFHAIHFLTMVCPSATNIVLSVEGRSDGEVKAHFPVCARDCVWFIFSCTEYCTASISSSRPCKHCYFIFPPNFHVSATSKEEMGETFIDSCDRKLGRVLNLARHACWDQKIDDAGAVILF